MSETRLNIKLLKKVRKRIATKPESYHQGNWIQPSKVAPCGYAACLAGETIICAAPSVREGIAELNELIRDRDTADRKISDRAAKLLGLKGSWASYCFTDNPKDGAETLIFDSGARFWPSDLREQFLDGEEADAAIGLLDRIIATGEVPVEY
jgi:hypothetical protein